jgi:hypothetical protein
MNQQIQYTTEASDNITLILTGKRVLRGEDLLNETARLKSEALRKIIFK